MVTIKNKYSFLYKIFDILSQNDAGIFTGEIGFLLVKKIRCLYKELEYKMNNPEYFD